MSIRILIADDAPFIRELLKELLEPRGFVIVGEAQDGVEAVELAEQLKPDVILMDLVMPKKSGVEATTEIVKRQPRVKVIACSTLDQETMMLKAIEAGCCHYVTKPFEAKDLVQAIEKAVQQGGEI